MPATFGVTDDFDLTAPAVSTIEESSTESEVEIKTIRDASGITCQAVPAKMVKTTVMIKGRGTSDAAVTTGAFSEGAVKVTSVKNAESNDDFPTYEITGVAYSNLEE